MKKFNIGFIGNFEVPYSTENDRAWSFENLGHRVIKFQENKSNADQIVSQLSNIDVLFYSHTHGWKLPGILGVFDKAKKAGVPTASVHLDRWAWLDRVKDVGKEATWFVDYIFMADGSPEAVELYEKNNLNWFWIKPGVVKRDCYLAEPDKKNYPHDIVFVGSRGYHHEYKFRPILIDWLASTYGDKFGHYGGDGLGTIRGNDLNILFASAKIVVGDSCFGGRPRYWSDRVTETMGRGGFLLHPHCDGLEIPGFRKYEAENLESLKAVIDYYMAGNFSEEYRINALIEGFNHVREYETYTNRAEEMLNIIFGNSNG